MKARDTLLGIHRKGLACLLSFATQADAKLAIRTLFFHAVRMLRPTFFVRFSVWMILLTSELATAESGKAKGDHESKAATRLPILSLEAKRHHAELSEVADQWQPDGHSWLSGEWQASLIKLNDAPLQTDWIAAIFSSAKSSQARVFLRDGRVLLGTLSWKDAHFVSPILGRVKLKADHLGHLILRSRSTDGSTGKPPAIAWILDHPQGRIIPVTSFAEKSALICHTTLGTLIFAWSEIETIRALPKGKSEHEIHLKNGSRLVAWPQWKLSGLSTETCFAWARTPTQLAAFLTETIQETPQSLPGLRLKDGSFLHGAPFDETTLWQIENSEIQLPCKTWVQLKQMAAPSPDASFLGPTFTLKTEAQTWIARPRQETFSWRCAGQNWLVPWTIVESIDLKQTGNP